MNPPSGAIPMRDHECSALAGISVWRWRTLVAAQAAGIALLGSWFHPWGRMYWDRLDMAVFQFTDASLGWGVAWQVLWAALNTRAFDLIAAGFFFVVYAVFIARGAAQLRAERIAAGIFIAGCTALTISLSSHWIFAFERLSPTWVVDGAQRLSELVPWIRHKDWSGKSFPGDHGIAVIMFTTMTWWVAGRGYGLVAAAGALVFALPRLVSGAHWLSDILAGSVGVALLVVSVALATPLLAVWVRTLRPVVASVLKVADRIWRKF